MSKISIGIDPDSTAHGVAIYIDGKLSVLKSMPLMELFAFITMDDFNIEDATAHIENVCGQNAAFYKKGVKNAAAGTAINRSIGKCQQAQLEVERMLGWVGVEVVRHRISKSWKDKNGKKKFELATKWKGRSNEDTRSAAYFGMLGVT